VFGVSPNRVFRRDAENCTRDACAPRTYPKPWPLLRFPEMISKRCSRGLRRSDFVVEAQDDCQ
jgi:hypothetical protein